jgi:hypothetical protein
MRNYEEPQITKLPNDPMSDSVERHPAYGQISASRVNGHVNLYGSDFSHNNCVRITISDSELHRSLSRDWPFSRKKLIEVELSEAQWATFVSSLNAGSGPQCTLQYVEGRGQIPNIPEPKEERSEQFSRELRAKLSTVENDLKKLRETIEAGKMTKKDKEDLLSRIAVIEGNLTPNLDYVAKSFVEHMEDTTEHAKIEINAYLTNAVQRAGLEALGGKPVLELRDNVSTSSDE